jgi:hypothetical protein
MPRRTLGDRPMTNAERQARYRLARATARPTIHYRRPAHRRSRAQRWRNAIAELVALQAEYKPSARLCPLVVQIIRLVPGFRGRLATQSCRSPARDISCPRPLRTETDRCGEFHQKPRERRVLMEENSPRMGPRMAADNLRSPSSADGDTSGLKNAAVGSTLGRTEPSI